MYPLKQGLKLTPNDLKTSLLSGWSSVSIKTRIETRRHLFAHPVVSFQVEVVYPLKQGLKL